MSARLHDVLGLPEARHVETNDRVKQFQLAFHEEMAKLNQALQTAAALASQLEYQSLAGQRMRLYEAFQKASAQIDPNHPAADDQSIERVMAAVNLVAEKASDLATRAQAGRDEWLKQETEFDDTLQRIGELQEARTPRAEAFAKVGDAIRIRAQQHRYSEAAQAFVQFRPKIAAAYDQFQTRANGDDDRPSVDGIASRDDANNAASSLKRMPRHQRKQELANMRRRLQQVMDRLGL